MRELGFFIGYVRCF
jgi:hypothetical protein